jgi:hypothetical protein
MRPRPPTKLIQFTLSPLCAASRFVCRLARPSSNPLHDRAVISWPLQRAEGKRIS